MTSYQRKYVRNLHADWEVPVWGNRFHLLCMLLFKYIRAQFLLTSMEVSGSVEMGMIVEL